VPYDPVRSLLDVIGTLSWISLAVFGPAGIAIVGWSAGIRNVFALIVLVVVVAPLYVAIWFAGAVSISGALGNPF
jgi:hypothetical protein